MVAMAMLVWYVGPAALLQTLARTHAGYVIGYFAAFLAVPYIYGMQLHGALRLAGHGIPVQDTVRAAAQSWSVGSLTPARAGDLSFAYFLRGAVPERDALAVVFADKLLSLLVLVLLAIGSAFVVEVPYREALIMAASLASGGVLGVLLLTRIPRLEPLRVLLAKSRVVPWTLVMAMLRWAYICAINLLIFRAVGYSPGLATVTAATAVGRLIATVPVSIGGVGIKEPAQILIYAGAAVPAEAVVAVSVLGMACGFAVAAVVPLLVRGVAR